MFLGIEKEPLETEKGRCCSVEPSPRSFGLDWRREEASRCLQERDVPCLEKGGRVGRGISSVLIEDTQESSLICSPVAEHEDAPKPYVCGISEIGARENILLDLFILHHSVQDLGDYMHGTTSQHSCSAALGESLH